MTWSAICFCQDTCIVWFSLLGSFLFAREVARETVWCWDLQVHAACVTTGLSTVVLSTMHVRRRFPAWCPSCLILNLKLIEIAFIPPLHPADFTQHGQRRGWCHCWCRCQCPVPEIGNNIVWVVLKFSIIGEIVQHLSCSRWCIDCNPTQKYLSSCLFNGYISFCTRKAVESEDDN